MMKLYISKPLVFDMDAILAYLIDKDTKVAREHINRAMQKCVEGQRKQMGQTAKVEVCRDEGQVMSFNASRRLI
jgi:hypothetical protein